MAQSETEARSGAHPSVETAWPARMSRREAAAYLRDVHGVRAAYQTLARHAFQGTGPAYRKQQRLCVYDKTELDRWGRSRLSPPCASTAEHYVREEQKKKAALKKGHSKRVTDEPERSAA